MYQKISEFEIIIKCKIKSGRKKVGEKKWEKKSVRKKVGEKK